MKKFTHTILLLALFVVFAAGCRKENPEYNYVEVESYAEYLHSLYADLDTSILEVPNLNAFTGEDDPEFDSTVRMYMGSNHIKTITEYEAECIKFLCDMLDIDPADVYGWEILLQEDDILQGNFQLYHADEIAKGTIQLPENFYTDMCTEFYD